MQKKKKKLFQHTLHTFALVCCAKLRRMEKVPLQQKTLLIDGLCVCVCVCVCAI